MDAYLLLPLIQAFFSLVLIAVVLKGHIWSSTHRLFSLFLLGLAIWGIMIFGMRASPDIEHAYLWEKWLVTVAPFTSVFFYHFAIRYTITRINRWLIRFFYTICLLFIPLSAAGLVVSDMQTKPYGYAPIFGPAGSFNMLFTFGVSLLTLLIFVKAYRTSRQAEQRNRIAYIITAMVFSFVGATFDILPVLGLPLYPGLIIGNIVFCSLTTTAIVRHNLLDVRIVVRKGAAYILTSAVIAIPFVGVFLLVTFFFKEVRFSPWVYFPLLIALAFILPQLWQWVQLQVDRWFYRNRYDYLKALEAFSQETQSITDSTRLGSTIVNLLSGALRTSSVYVLQPLPPNGDFTMAFSSDLPRSPSHVMLKRDSLLVKWLERSKEMLSYEDIDIIPQLQGVTSKEKGTLQQLRIKFIIGLKTPTGRLSGLLILGPKLSEQPYTIEDKQLIYAISSQAAINLENVRLYNESQREIMERKRAEEELLQSHERLRDLSAHIESLREAERTSIAREIHDELGQALTALKMDLSWVNKRLPNEQEALIKKIEETSSYVSKIIQTVKRISTELRPGVLDDLGLTAAVEWQVQQFQERTRIKCELTAGEDINLDRDLTTGIFRILQEALTNVARHANATKVKVNLKERDGLLVLQVSDNGKGITKKQIAHPKSFGLIGMRERAHSWSGNVKIDGTSGKGTTVTVSIPLNRKEECDDKNTSRR